MLELHSNRVRIGDPHIGNKSNGSKIVSLLPQSFNNGGKHVAAQRSVPLTRVSSDHTVFADRIERKAVGEEFTVRIEHLGCERKRGIEQPVEIILYLLRGTVAPRSHHQFCPTDQFTPNSRPHSI